MVAQKKEKPVPPAQHFKHTGHHWLEMIDTFTGYSLGLIVLQWNPGSQTWTHSNEHDTFKGSIETEGWKYVSYIPEPNESSGG